MRFLKTIAKSTFKLKIAEIAYPSFSVLEKVGLNCGKGLSVKKITVEF